MGGKVNVFDQLLVQASYPRHDVISDEKLAADL